MQKNAASANGANPTSCAARLTSTPSTTSASSAATYDPLTDTITYGDDADEVTSDMTPDEVDNSALIAGGAAAGGGVVLISLVTFFAIKRKQRLMGAVQFTTSDKV